MAACISILNNKQQDIIQTKSEEFSVCYIHDVINTVNQPWNHRLKTWCTRTCALTLDTTKSVEKKQGQRSLNKNMPGSGCDLTAFNSILSLFSIK